ncbi:DUF3854 domain-containing protein [Sutcliffiella horikoshii]|uniref:DUF3854 domain-containing protein n=1 Tax=Sutcliffiella horikoshii TaxID=79883 RepID=UPI00203B876E|nr:DUF3854 domain-containing protein [Sutcliffiella horikoshii]MCM3619706.1 DUF3854 domain-containing protein [Sutcliffiella horikoshii]
MINKEGEAVACIRKESKTAFSKNSACPSWLHFLKGNKRKLDVAATTEVEQNEKLNSSSLNKVYRALLDSTNLEDSHYKHLTSSKRGLSDQQVRNREYRSFPSKPWEVVKLIEEATGISDFKGVPGFYKAKGRYGEYWTINGNDGILIPFRNINNEIEGFQIRVDNPPNDVEIKRAKEGLHARVIKQPNLVQVIFDGEIIQEVEMELKQENTITYNEKVIGWVKLTKGKRYFWFSSANKDCGTGPGNPAPVHVSVPSELLKKWEVGSPLKVNTVWLGEGPLKGDIAVDLIVDLYDELELQDIGTTILSLPGVGSWRLAIPLLEEMGVEQVNICFDMDAISNPYVKKHLMEAAKELKAKGYRGNLVLWSEKENASGIDDLLLKRTTVPQIKRLF